MKKIILILVMSAFFNACTNRSDLAYENQKYKTIRATFNATFIEQFPNAIHYPLYKLISNTNEEKNDVSLLLYEYDVDTKTIITLENKIKNESIASFTSKDTSLLIVNRFETEDSYDNLKTPEIKDSLSINRSYTKNIYPIPNFIKYGQNNKYNELRLDDSFIMYVLEAKSGNHFKEFDLQPNPQMPQEWKNGYSKGIAISKEKHTIIYWSIIW